MPVIPYRPDPGGVAGAERAGDPLLERTDTGAAACDVVAGLAWHLHRAGLSSRVPAGESMHARMTAPRAGDLVVVADAVWHRDPDTRFRGVGYLLVVREEWATTRAVWERERAEDGLAEDDRLVERRAWYVQYGESPADVCRWVNCEVWGIPGHGERWWR